MKLEKPLNLDFGQGEDQRSDDSEDYKAKFNGLAKELKKANALVKEKDIAIQQLLDYINTKDSGLINRDANLPIDWVGKIYKQRELTKLADLSGSDKGFRKHLYTTVYQEFIKPEKVKTLLEIGLLCHDDQKALGGGESFDLAPSLDMWCEYLPETKVYGFDIQDFSRAKGNWSTIFRGDQSKRKDLRKITEVQSSFDVIIDDALHASEHQQVTLSYLFKYLSSGGIYIIEDLHYQPDEEEVSIKTLKLLKEMVRTGKWNSPYANDEEKRTLEESLESIQFFDSMKLPRSQSKDAFCVLKKI